MVKRQNRIRNLIQLLLINMSLSCCDLLKYCYDSFRTVPGLCFSLQIFWLFSRTVIQKVFFHFFNCRFIVFLINSNLKLSAFLLRYMSFYFWCGKKPVKNMISSYGGTEKMKKIFKLLSGWTKKIRKSYEKQIRFFHFTFRWSVHTQGISFQVSFCWDCTTTDNERWEAEKKLHQR